MSRKQNAEKKTPEPQIKWEAGTSPSRDALALASLPERPQINGTGGMILEPGHYSAAVVEAVLLAVDELRVANVYPNTLQAMMRDYVWPFYHTYPEFGDAHHLENMIRKGITLPDADIWIGKDGKARVVDRLAFKPGCYPPLVANPLSRRTCLVCGLPENDGEFVIADHDFVHQACKFYVWQARTNIKRVSETG